MAKKKSASKKHKFKHAVGPAEASPAVSASASAANKAAVARPSNAQVAAGSGAVARDFSYVPVDLRRIGVMAISLVLLELVLYYFLLHTSFGEAIYSLVKV